MDRALAADARLGRQSRIVTARRLLDERGVLLGLVVVAATFGVLIGPQFFTGANLELMARQTAIVCVAALGMTMVIVAGGIDLSVGSIVALSTVVTRCCFVTIRARAARSSRRLVPWRRARPAER
jgi:Ribose/xylose/arabinose/galactoside ABC-type transport systems, permease components